MPAAAARDGVIREERFRTIHRRVHAGHPACIRDEWLSEPCRTAARRLVAPIVWSRRNGPWTRVDVLFVGAAPGNAGGKGSGDLGAHGTRIPFGGDIAGANLEVLLGAAGLNRNEVFIVAAYNRLPERGGGEPTLDEIRAPVGDHASSIDLLRATIIATGPKLIVALGNVALRCIVASVEPLTLRLPGLTRLEKRGLVRGRVIPLAAVSAPDEEFVDSWRAAQDTDLPALLWLMHPSGQNMSPFASEETAFHQRLLDTRAALRAAVTDLLDVRPPETRPPIPHSGIYALAEWRERIAPRLVRLDRRWRDRGI